MLKFVLPDPYKSKSRWCSRQIYARICTMSKIYNKTFPRIILVVCGVAIASCVAVPIPPSDEKPFQEQSLEFLKIGLTSRQDIDTHFSNNSDHFLDIRFEADRVRVYGASADTWNWFVCGVSYTGSVCGLLLPQSFDREYYLVLRFDSHGILENYGLSKYGCDTSVGLCATYDGRETMAMDLVRGLRVDHSEPDSLDRCTIYIYTEGPFWTTPVLSVAIDGQHVAFLIEEPGFLQFHTSADLHQIQVELNSGVSLPGQPILANQSVSCETHRDHYLYVRQKWSALTGEPRDVKVVNQSKSVGEAEIEKRWRVLLKDPID